MAGPGGRGGLVAPAGLGASLTSLRLLAAIVVVVDHAAPLTGSPRFLLPGWTGTTLGTVAVIVFFGVSGFQVTASWVRDPHLGRWAVKRVLRIWPPLLAMLLLTVVVLGPAMTTLPLAAYFSDSRTWAYVVDNAGLFAVTYELPGVFLGNPYPGAPVNGSIWTLGMEVVAYCLVPLVLVFGPRVARSATPAVVVVMAAVVVGLSLAAAEPRALVQIPLLPLATFVTAFLLGQAVFLHGIRRTARGSWALAALVAYALVQVTPASPVVGPLLLDVGVVLGSLWLAQRWPRGLTGPRRWTGVSYGVYLYGFPITQTVIALGVTHPVAAAAVSTPAAYVAGVVSWALVEQPTSELKRYLRRPERSERSDDDPPTAPLALDPDLVAALPGHPAADTAVVPAAPPVQA